MEGGNCEFLRHKYKLLLQSTEFGSIRTSDRESNLHSHLGYGFALDWEINKNPSKLWRVCFTSIIDCYGLCFMLIYEGPNLVVLRMQMHLMIWKIDLYHRRSSYLVSPDYFSCLRLDICFNEMTRLYLNNTINIHKLYPPTSEAMQPENMTGYCAPRVRSELTTEATTIFR